MKGGDDGWRTVKRKRVNMDRLKGEDDGGGKTKSKNRTKITKLFLIAAQLN